jgi:hypothetical protein
MGDVRFGSNSEVTGLERDVRSSLKSRHRQTAPACRKSACQQRKSHLHELSKEKPPEGEIELANSFSAANAGPPTSPPEARQRPGTT